MLRRFILFPSVMLWFAVWARLPNVLHSTKYDTVFWGIVPFVTLCLDTVLNVTVSWHGTTITISRLPITNGNTDTNAKCYTVVHDNICNTKCKSNVIGLILVTLLNALTDCLFINPLCAHIVFERSTDREWPNSFGTSSDGWVDSLEHSRQCPGNSKTIRTLRQQLTIIYWNVLV